MRPRPSRVLTQAFHRTKGLAMDRPGVRQNKQAPDGVRRLSRAYAAMQKESLLQSRVDVSMLQHLLGVRPDAEIGHAPFRNVGPAVRYACRNHGDIAYRDLAGDVIAHDLAAARGAVEDLGHFAVRT